MAPRPLLIKPRPVVPADHHLYGYGSSHFVYHAFLYDGSSLVDLGTLGGTWSVALGLNDQGQAVGWSTGTGDAPQRGFLYSGSSMQDLNSLLDSSGSGWTVVEAWAIDDNGVIAAVAMNSAGQDHAAVLTPVRTVAGTVNLQNYLASAIAGTQVYN